VKDLVGGDVATLWGQEEDGLFEVTVEKVSET
jgi:hypothetical protein